MKNVATPAPQGDQTDEFMLEKSWHILYVEDDEDDYILAREMLAEAKGQKVNLTWATNCIDGCRELGKAGFDAVLVDYDLGGATGIELIRQFSEDYPAPLILFTGRGSHDVDLEAMAAGATLYLTKNEANPLLLERAIRYAIELKQREKELRLANECLEQELAGTMRLRALSERLVSEGDLQVFYQEILDAAIDLTQADAGTVQILDSNTQELLLLATQGFERKMVDHFQRVDASSQTSCGIALATRTRSFVDFDVPASMDPTGSLRMHAEAGYLSAQSTPLVSRSGKAIGMFSTHWRDRRRPNEHELRFLDLLARQAADLIESKQAEEALRTSQALLAVELADSRRLQQISTQLIQEETVEALYEHILGAAMALMRSDAGSMQVYDPQTHTLRLLAWQGFAPESAEFWKCVGADSNGTCSAAMQHRQRVIVRDVEANRLIAGSDDLAEFRRSGLRSVQSTPLWARSGQLMGMISTHWCEPHTPAERELQMLDVLARQAADLIERRQAEGLLQERNEALRRSQADYQALFNSIDEGFFVIDVIFDEQDQPVDLYYLQTNAAATEMLGRDYSGLRLREISPDYEPYWYEIFGQVAKTGKSVRLEQYAEPDQRWYSFFVFKMGGPESRRIGNIFQDITERKLRELGPVS